MNDADFVVRIIDRQIEERKINIKGAPVIVAGGYGMGSKENFDLLFELADVLERRGRRFARGGRRGNGRTRPAGRTNRRYGASETVHRLRYLGPDPAYGRYGSIVDDHLDQYRSDAPINKIADYAITGDVTEVIPKMIKYHKQNSK